VRAAVVTVRVAGAVRVVGHSGYGGHEVL
jgi:hypothetical protein